MPRDKKKPWRQWPSDRPIAEERPTPQEALFVEAYIKTSNLSESARAAGYGHPHSSKNTLLVQGLRLLKRPHIALLIKEHREKLFKRTHYAAIDAMEEAEEGMRLAKATDNANAYVKAVELRSKLHGLIIEKSAMQLIGGFTIAISGIDDPKAVPIPVPAGTVPLLPAETAPALPPATQSVSQIEDGPKSILDDIAEAEKAVSTAGVSSDELNALDPFADPVDPFAEPDPFA